MSGWVSSTGWNINLAAPGPIGNATPSSGAFTTLNASSNVTLSGGTANGVVYLDGSKVATSGTGIQFSSGKLLVGWTTPPLASASLFADGVQSTNTSGGGGYVNIALSGGGESFYTHTGTAGAETYTERMRIDPNGNILINTTTSPSGSQVSGNAIVNGVVSTAGYTVATLPTGMPTGSRAYVTDALTPVVLTTVAGGGAVVVPVFYDGTNWIVG